LSGDEYAVMVPDGDSTHLHDLLESLAPVTEPIKFSYGVASTREYGRNAVTLLKAADDLMNENKNAREASGVRIPRKARDETATLQMDVEMKAKKRKGT
jgi:hypothetical protein